MSDFTKSVGDTEVRTHHTPQMLYSKGGPAAIFLRFTMAFGISISSGLFPNRFENAEFFSPSPSEGSAGASHHGSTLCFIISSLFSRVWADSL